MHLPWQDISYLLRGNERQRRAHRALQDLKVFEVLREYTPTLVGTIPINIDVEDSDLDIVCCAGELDTFSKHVFAAYGALDGFRIKQKLIKGVPSVVASFEYAGFPVEIFGQAKAVEEQHAYRHMVVEHRLLTIGGPAARYKIRRLKRAGLKTEPAFGRYFKLVGDPYEQLLELSRLTMQQLDSVVTMKG